MKYILPWVLVTFPLALAVPKNKGIIDIDLTGNGVVGKAVSYNGRCGTFNSGMTCRGSSNGNCCSQWGWW
jgi:hypothetical protein